MRKAKTSELKINTYVSYTKPCHMQRDMPRTHNHYSADKAVSDFGCAPGRLFE